MGNLHIHSLTRRDFIKLSGAALGGVSLACGAGSKVVELIAVPTPLPPAAHLVPTLAPGTFADTILVSGNILTMDAKRTAAKALAIKDGSILLVGDDQAVRNLAGAGSKVFDLAGRTVTPVLIEHPCSAAECCLPG